MSGIEVSKVCTRAKLSILARILVSVARDDWECFYSTLGWGASPSRQIMYKSEMQKNRCYLTIHSMTALTLADLFCNSFGVRDFVPEGVFGA